LDTDGDGVPDHRDLEINSPDLLVNEDGVSISLDEWKAMHAPTKGDPSTFVQDSMTIVTELTAEQVAQMLANAAYMADNLSEEATSNVTPSHTSTPETLSEKPLEKVDASSGIVFRVQYGAFLEANAPDAASYTHETVTVLKTGHGLALHVGEARNTIESARQTLESAKALNHPDAFITAYQHGKRISIDEATAKQHNASDIVDEASHGNDISEGTGALDLSQIHFHVQLGRYSAGVPVEVLNRFLQMGHIIQRLESDGTHRYLTAPVHSEETARQNLAAAIDMGFDDAFLIAEINGEPATMAEAQEARAKQLALIANN
jgi:predicted RNase H-like HicB family nuclease